MHMSELLTLLLKPFFLSRWLYLALMFIIGLLVAGMCLIIVYGATQIGFISLNEKQWEATVIGFVIMGIVFGVQGVVQVLPDCFPKKQKNKGR